MQMSFGSMEMDARIRCDSALLKAHALVDWEGLRSQLVGLYKREASRGGGQEPIDPLGLPRRLSSNSNFILQPYGSATVAATECNFESCGDHQCFHQNSDNQPALRAWRRVTESGVQNRRG